MRANRTIPRQANLLAPSKPQIDSKRADCAPRVIDRGQAPAREILDLRLAVSVRALLAVRIEPRARRRNGGAVAPRP